MEAGEDCLEAGEDCLEAGEDCLEAVETDKADLIQNNGKC